MRTIMVRYKTSEAYADVNATMVHAVFDELRVRAPRGIRYATYRLTDGVSFVHIATVENPDANPLLTLAPFKAFQEGLRLTGRCVEPPVVTELSAVDSYAGGAP